MSNLLIGHEAIVASALFLIFLAVLVFAARPGSAVNRTFGALFLFRGMADLTWQLQRSAPSAADALAYARTATWYELPSILLTVLLLHAVFPPARRRAWRRAGLVAAGLATVAFAAAFANDESTGALRVKGSAFFYLAPAPSAYLFAATLWLTQVAVVLVAARVAASAERSAIERRRAGLVGLAFALLQLQLGAYLTAQHVANLVQYRQTPDPFVALAGGAALAGLVAVAFAAPRLSNAFGDRARILALAAMGLAVLSGAFDGTLGLLQAWGLPKIPGYLTARFVWVSASAACLALALVRYGLAGFGERMQRRVAALAHVLLVAAAALLPVGVAIAFLAASPVAIIVALLLGAGAITLSPAPMRAVSGAVSKLLLLDPADPAAVGERARAYAAALRAGDAAGLRRDLAISDGEHERLLADARDADAPRLLGRYRVERELGRGASGTALLATDTASGQLVVLKRFHARHVERSAIAEARALSLVRHPRVVPLLAVERVNDEVFLALGYVEGGNLQSLLEREGPLPPERAARLVLDALEGLDALHAAGLAHGDVKPGNVLVGADGRALLADLGATQAIARADLDATLTTGPVLGSFGTVAPEVLRGARRSPASDLYSAGAILYRLLTGDDYVRLSGRDAVQAMDAILHEPPRLPHPRVPPPLEAVIARALAKDPALRFEDARRMRDALEAALR